MQHFGMGWEILAITRYCVIGGFRFEVLVVVRWR